MSKAYLTIDDAPSKQTPLMVDYLYSKGITPVINFIGKNIEEHYDEAVYVAKRGIVIGNHSYSHPHFSKLTIDEAREEIQRTEELINKVYRDAGVKREHKVFRFPYGDKGGENYSELQKMLKEEFEFERLDDSNVNYHWWKEGHLHTDIDMFWTFDFLEYKLIKDKDFTWDSIVDRILDKNPKEGGTLLGDAFNIILMHDIEETDKALPNYYVKIIDYTLSLGVEYVAPKFIAMDN